MWQGRGSIAEAELIDMADLLGIKMSPSEAKAAIHLLDDDNTKSIDFEEFAHWWDSSEELALRMKRALASEQHRLKHAFDSVNSSRVKPGRVLYTSRHCNSNAALTVVHHKDLNLVRLKVAI